MKGDDESKLQLFVVFFHSSSSFIRRLLSFVGRIHDSDRKRNPMNRALPALE